MPIKAKGVGNIFITTIMGIICDNLLLAFRRKRTNKPMEINASRTKLRNLALGIRSNERRIAFVSFQLNGNANECEWNGRAIEKCWCFSFFFFFVFFFVFLL